MTFGLSYAFEEWDLWYKPVFWLGDFLFGWQFNPEQLYIGFDSKFEFIRYILCSILAITFAILWILIDKRFKANYDAKFKVLVQTVLRYNIAFTIFTYGLSKVFNIQFGSMSIDSMEGIIGDNSGMGLMWTFFSYSKTVTQFSGWLEVIGGLLLLHRKTTYLGTLILFGVMANVVLLDIGYNVSVTFYAIQIFVLILILMSDQFYSLYRYLVLSKTATPLNYKPLFTTAKGKSRSRVVKAVLIIFMFSMFFIQFNSFTANLKNDTEWYTNKQTIETFSSNGDTLEVGKDTKRWKEITFNGLTYYPESFEIVYDNDSTERFDFKIDSVSNTIQYSTFIDPTPDYDLFSTLNDSLERNRQWRDLSYEKLSDTDYIFKGVFKGDTLRIKTTAKNYKSYPLIQQKGRWIIDLE